MRDVADPDEDSSQCAGIGADVIRCMHVVDVALLVLGRVESGAVVVRFTRW